MATKPTLSSILEEASGLEIPEEIVDQANDYFIDFGDGIENPSLQRYEQFQRWLDADVRHRLAFASFQVSIGRFCEAFRRVFGLPDDTGTN